MMFEWKHMLTLIALVYVPKSKNSLSPWLRLKIHGSGHSITKLCGLIFVLGWQGRKAY